MYSSLKFFLCEYYVMKNSFKFVYCKDLNLCIIDGYIATEIDFKFLFRHKKYISVAKCFIKFGKNLLKICGYDAIADKLYANYEIGSYIVVEGSIVNSCIEVVKIHEC